MRQEARIRSHRPWPRGGDESATFNTQGDLDDGYAMSTAAVGQVPEEQQRAIDRIVGARGTYIADDRAYKIVLPREAATIVQDYQTLSPNLGLNSWVTLSSAIHQEAILAGQFLLLDDEVDAVLATALESGLALVLLSHKNQGSTAA